MSFQKAERIYCIQHDTTTAIRIFLTQALAVNGFPFEIRKPNPIRPLSEQGQFEDADDVIREMRTKYGL